MKRNILDSPRLLELKRKKQKIFAYKIFLFVFSFLFIFVCLAYVARIPSLNFGEVEIIGNKIVDAELIKTAVKKELVGNYFWFFPKTNIFLYPKDNINKILQSTFFRLKDINLSLGRSATSEDLINKKVLEVSVNERTAVYTWCGNAPSTQTGLPETTANPKCYFMDADGFIFDEAPYFSGTVYFKFYGSGNLGTYFAKETFKQLINFRNTLLSLPLKPVSIFIGDDGDSKIFLSNLNKTSEQPYIAFNINADFKKIAENLDTALGTEPLLSDFNNKYSKLEYIDLRFGNKVYYKFR